MKAAEDPILDEIKVRLQRIFSIKKIYLYGSRARGTAHVDSDYDILVVVKSSDISYHERNVKGRIALRGLGVAIDISVCTQQEFDEMKNELSSLPEIVMHEGLELDLG